MNEIRSWSEARTQDDSVDDANRYPLDHESLCFHITFKQCFLIIASYQKIVIFTQIWAMYCCPLPLLSWHHHEPPHQTQLSSSQVILVASGLKPVLT